MNRCLLCACVASDLPVRTDYGFLDEQNSTTVWSSKQNDSNGHFIDYRFVEEFTKRLAGG